MKKRGTSPGDCIGHARDKRLAAWPQRPHNDGRAYVQTPRLQRKSRKAAIEL